MKKSVRIFWILLLSGIFFFIGLIIAINLGKFGAMPSLAELENPSILLSSELYAEDGTLLGRYYKENGNRSNVKYSDISPNVTNALIATEDKRFKEHSGIDPKGVMRAIMFLGTKGGASTITQQLALNMFDEKRSYNVVIRTLQKLKEWSIAVKLERNFTKEEIIALYLNVVPYSENVFGIRNAALTFFQKEPSQLNIEEAAVLVGMVNGTYKFNPLVFPERSMARRNLVIKRMLEGNYITEEQAAAASAAPINLSRFKKVLEQNGLAPYFREHMRQEIKEWCSAHTNPSTKTPYNIYRDGLRIYTTINPLMQQYAEEAVANQMPMLQQELNSQRYIKDGSIWKDHQNVLEAAMKASDRWRNMKLDSMPEDEIKKSFYQKTKMKIFAWNAKKEKDTLLTPLDSIKYHKQLLQTSFMVMDPSTGEVKAWVGGIDFRSFKYDHVNINTKRQVGSSIKPFLYAEAIEELGYNPESTVEDLQQNFPGHGWVPATPKSCKGDTCSMMNALTYSRNCATAYIMKQVTPKRFAEFIKQTNIPTKIEPLPSTCLGTSDLSMYEMLWGYTMFANRGITTQPTYMTRIEDKNGNVIATFKPDIKQVISEPAAYLMTRLLAGPVEYGTAKGLRASIGVKEMGGKTGTTNNNSDAWFIGFTPQLLGGTWTGCDDRFIRLETRLGMGGTAAKPIWEYFFKKVYADKKLALNKTATFNKPASMGENQWGKPTKLDTVPPEGMNGPKNDIGDDYGGYDAAPSKNPEKPTGFDTSSLIPKKKDTSKAAVPANSLNTVKPVQSNTKLIIDTIKSDKKKPGGKK